MKKFAFCGLLVALVASASAQVTRTSVPLGKALDKALDKSLLTGKDARPFHIRIAVAQPDKPDSAYQATIEEWWASPQQWRREVSAKRGLKQTIVFANGNKTERDEGEYFPLWLRTFVTATFDPVPNATAWTALNLQIVQLTMPNGAKSDACARIESKIGVGDNTTDAFSNVCFDNEGRLKFVGSPRYSMEFNDYRGFGKKQVARHLADNADSGARLLGSVVQLDDLSKETVGPDFFSPLPANDSRFESVAVGSAQMLTLSASAPPVSWPPVHSGNVHGQLSMYVSVDRTGQVREVRPLNSDNAGLGSPTREQLLGWKLKPAVDKSGAAVQVDGGLSFTFDTKISDPLPELSDTEVRALAKITEPQWPRSLKAGEIVEVDISVNQQGKLAGYGMTHVPPAAQGAVMNAIAAWSFHPLVRNGVPQYFHGVVRFIVP
ncbi:MAG: hypothetical protein ABI147_05485 [Acidobacteriaceae bacterium]